MLHVVDTQVKAIQSNMRKRAREVTTPSDSPEQTFNPNFTLTSCVVTCKLINTLDQMGPFHILLDEMGLPVDQNSPNGIRQSGNAWHQLCV